MNSCLLTELEVNGIITHEDLKNLVSDFMNLRQRKEYLEKHKYKIYMGSDGRWFTRFPNKDKGSVQRAFHSKEEVENAVVEYYKTMDNTPSLKDLFFLAMEEKKLDGSISPSTLTRNLTDFNRFFTEFGLSKINMVTADDVEEFLRNQKRKHKLTSKGYANLLTVTRYIFRYAKRKKLIDFRVDDVINDMDWGKNAFRYEEKDDTDEVFSDDEMALIAIELKRRHTVKSLGLLLCFATGLRIGELAALKWEDIEGHMIFVHRTETTWTEDGKTHCEVIDLPKTKAGKRRVPIPSQGSWILDEIKELNPAGEYVFMENYRRIRAGYFRKRLYFTCDAVGIKRRSPHKIRKTYASILLDNNIAPKIIIENMGHTDISTTNGSYAKRRKTGQQLSEVMSSIPEFAHIEKEM